MEAVHQGAGQVLAGCEAGIGIKPVDFPLDFEDGVDPFHRFVRNWRDLMGGFALADVPGNIRPESRALHVQRSLGRLVIGAHAKHIVSDLRHVGLISCQVTFCKCCHGF